MSFAVAVAIGYCDYETKSLTHLFTAEWGNIATLAILTLLFSILGWFGIASMKHLLGIDGFDAKP